MNVPVATLQQLCAGAAKDDEGRLVVSGGDERNNTAPSRGINCKEEEGVESACEAPSAAASNDDDENIINKTGSNEYEDQEHPDTYRIRTETKEEDAIAVAVAEGHKKTPSSPATTSRTSSSSSSGDVEEDVVVVVAGVADKDEQPAITGNIADATNVYTTATGAATAAEGLNAVHDEVNIDTASQTQGEGGTTGSTDKTDTATTTSTKTSTNDYHPKVQSFMQNICFELRNTDANDDDKELQGGEQFYVSVNLSYLQSMTAREFLSGLDEILGVTDRACIVGFLARDEPPAIGTTFWEYVNDNYISSNTSTDKTTTNTSTSTSELSSSPADRRPLDYIPLYMLVLLHFEYSAYRTHNCSRHHVKCSAKEFRPTSELKNAISSHSQLTVPLEKVVKRLAGNKDYDGSVQKATQFLQSLLEDSGKNNLTLKNQTHTNAGESNSHSSGKSLSPPPPPPSAVLDELADNETMPSPSATLAKNAESDAAEAELDDDDVDSTLGTPPSSSPKSKSGRKSSGKSGRKRKKKNKKKRGSSAAQEKSTSKRNEGETEKTEDEGTEKSKTTDDDVADDEMSGFNEAIIIDVSTETVETVETSTETPSTQKHINKLNIDQTTGDNKQSGTIQRNKVETVNKSDKGSTMTKTPSNQDVIPSSKCNVVLPPGQVELETAASFDDDGTESSKLALVGLAHDPPEEDGRIPEATNPESITAEEQDDNGDVPINDSATADDGEWETVGSRTRNTRKKKCSNDRSTISGGRPGQLAGEQGNSSRRKRDRDRKRSQTRKAMKEAQPAEDAAIDGSRRARSESIGQPPAALTPSVSTDKPGSSVVTKIPSKVSPIPVARRSSGNESGTGTSGTSMRDVLLGKITDTSTNDPHASQHPKAKSLSCSERNSPTNEKVQSNKIEPATKTGPAADQNTIPTVPETLSAVSATSAFTPSINNVTPRGIGMLRNTDSGSEEESDAAQKEPDSLPSSTKGLSPSPPLPTLLNPGNNNSSSSSVASSLEAPHTREHGNKSHPSEDDVGFHLLGVCKRLSNDVSIFMKRRDEALAVRRRERRLVLNALENSLGTLWPGMCSVEMYGSCATNLDLPSSDLDVVVRGLDQPRPLTNQPSHSPASKSEASVLDMDSGPTKKTVGVPRVNSQPAFSHYGPDSHQYSPHQHNTPVLHQQTMYGQMSLNAERVVRLSMELERQPWAVHVKAIPTATVPVIKILADPARVPGGSSKGTGDWFLQHAPVTSQATQAGVGKLKTPGQQDPSSMTVQDPQSRSQNAIVHFSSNAETPPLWRGADVTNGLLNVDVTFEGPEHGGIGSTKFSQRVVEDFASRSGLSPEETPEVQALMVLKELLAQRRLNEPFSGGLSSYALLLLVVSVLKEREIIKEELDKVELQRRDVALGGENSALQSPNPPQQGRFVVATQKTISQSSQKIKNKGDDQYAKAEIATPELDNIEVKHRIQNGTESSTATKANKGAKPTKNVNGQAAPATSKPSCSSWASIAKLTDGEQKPLTASTETTGQPLPPAAQPSRRVLKKPSSFADAVSKGVPPTPVLPCTGKPANFVGAADNNKNAQVTTAPVVKKTKNGKKARQGATEVSSLKSAGAPELPSLQPNLSSTPPEVPSNDQNTSGENAKSSSSVSTLQERVMEIVLEGKKLNSADGKGGSKKQGKSSSTDNTSVAVLSNPDESKFPQGFHDVIEVLCSGDTTPGKLLMHFLLFYGQHFDSHSTAIDYSGTHTRDLTANLGYSLRSPYMKRQAAGSYDPVTGMLTVDPIVVYDPLKGAESNNVARSCFLWSNVRWVFTQSYMTLSSAAETNQGSASDRDDSPPSGATGRGPTYGHDKSGNVVVDPSSPLLELLLSF